MERASKHSRMAKAGLSMRVRASIALQGSEGAPVPTTFSFAFVSLPLLIELLIERRQRSWGSKERAR